MIGWKGVLGAAVALAPVPAMAQEGAGAPRDAGRIDRIRAPELIVGVFEHGANFHPLGAKLIFDLPPPPPGTFYDGTEEDGTVDVQVGWRSAPLRLPLRPMLTGKLQISTAGRTSFASVGVELRQHVLKGRLYGAAGIGVAVIDGYATTPDPFAPGLSQAEATRRYAIYRHRTAFGSRVLFNPNASIGLRLDPRWAVELAWEHFSHRGLFSERNPGIDNIGLRLVRKLGR